METQRLLDILMGNADACILPFGSTDRKQRDLDLQKQLGQLKITYGFIEGEEDTCGMVVTRFEGEEKIKTYQTIAVQGQNAEVVGQGKIQIISYGQKSDDSFENWLRSEEYSVKPNLNSWHPRLEWKPTISESDQPYEIQVANYPSFRFFRNAQRGRQIYISESVDSSTTNLNVYGEVNNLKPNQNLEIWVGGIGDQNSPRAIWNSRLT